MPDLHLNLKAIYWNDIHAGTKMHEFRLCTPYWQKRLEGKVFDRILVKKAYPKADDQSQILVRPWQGYEIQTLSHPFFGPDPVQVYAIKVN